MQLKSHREKIWMHFEIEYSVEVLNLPTSIVHVENFSTITFVAISHSWGRRNRSMEEVVAIRRVPEAEAVTLR